MIPKQCPEEQRPRLASLPPPGKSYLIEVACMVGIRATPPGFPPPSTTISHHNRRHVRRYPGPPHPGLPLCFHKDKCGGALALWRKHTHKSMESTSMQFSCSCLMEKSRERGIKELNWVQLLLTGFGLKSILRQAQRHMPKTCVEIAKPRSV